MTAPKADIVTLSWLSPHCLQAEGNGTSLLKEDPDSGQQLPASQDKFASDHAFNNGFLCSYFQWQYKLTIYTFLPFFLAEGIYLLMNWPELHKADINYFLKQTFISAGAFERPQIMQCFPISFVFSMVHVSVLGLVTVWQNPTSAEWVPWPPWHGTKAAS